MSGQKAAKEVENSLSIQDFVLCSALFCFSVCARMSSSFFDPLACSLEEFVLFC